MRALQRRLGEGALVVALVVAASFALIRLVPGDPFAGSLEEENVPAEVREAQARAHGFDRPIPVQFVLFLRNIATGDLGWSFSRNQPVREALAALLPPTLLLMGAGLLLGLVGGVALGAWQGWRGETRLTRATGRLALGLLSVPEFVLALLFVMGPALAWGWFPVAMLRRKRTNCTGIGRSNPCALAWGWFPVAGMRSDVRPGGLAGVADLLAHLALPALTLGLVIAAWISRHQRRAMQGVMDEDFLRAARAKGVPEGRVFLRHALRNALVPVLTLTGVILPALVGGAVLVETVFAWPGMGRAIVLAVDRRDYPLVTGAVLVSSVAVVAGTIVADLAVAWADPRRRDR
jgi:peptide/nickel transport system permease protein